MLNSKLTNSLNVFIPPKKECTDAKGNKREQHNETKDECDIEIIFLFALIKTPSIVDGHLADTQFSV